MKRVSFQTSFWIFLCSPRASQGNMALAAKKSAINGLCSRLVYTSKQDRVKNPSKLKLSPIRLRCKEMETITASEVHRVGDSTVLQRFHPSNCCSPSQCATTLTTQYSIQESIDDVPEIKSLKCCSCSTSGHDIDQHSNHGEHSDLEFFTTLLACSLLICRCSSSRTESKT